MDIAALVNPVSEALPRRSPSGSHNNILAPSPALSSANLPATPKSTHFKAMSRKRKRADPKPIWAVREAEVVDGQNLQQFLDQRQRQQSRPPQPQSQPPPGAIRNGHPPPPAMNASQPESSGTLIGYERPISDDRRVYDEVQRQVCDFLYDNVVTNNEIRQVIHESPETTVEVEARWGQIIRHATGQRLMGDHKTECVVRDVVTSMETRFESTMTVAQHQKMNQYLNKQVHLSKPESPYDRPEIRYKHTKVTDQQYELDQESLLRLSPATRNILGNKRARVRVSRDQKTGEVIASIIKHKVLNIEISSPQTEWDYRIGINLEIAFPGPVDGLTEAVEKGRGVEAMKRYKDRMSYSYLGAFQVDLTQVTQDGKKVHELELELDSTLLLDHGDRVRAQQPSEFETLINGMINNLRVLSREMTPMKQNL
ncbi:hypothetical protein N0V90_013273 [Kalmusia sp. IMI 367209]|nr:hypothetical protein N0V90_013273 [Kalmusia sp. IMI 367209]